MKLQLDDLVHKIYTNSYPRHSLPSRVPSKSSIEEKVICFHSHTSLNQRDSHPFLTHHDFNLAKSTLSRRRRRLHQTRQQDLVLASDPQTLRIQVIRQIDLSTIGHPTLHHIVSSSTIDHLAFNNRTNRFHNHYPQST